jgi:hypothetical protein
LGRAFSLLTEPVALSINCRTPKQRRGREGDRMGKHVLLIEDEPNIIEAIS